MPAPCSEAKGQYLVLAEADGILGLVDDGLVRVRLTRGLVGEGLAGGLLAVWDEVAVIPNVSDDVPWWR
jgi:hypothetical protein